MKLILEGSLNYAFLFSTEYSIIFKYKDSDFKLKTLNIR